MKLIKSIVALLVLSAAACAPEEAKVSKQESAAPTGVRQKVVASNFSDVMWVPAQAAPRAQAVLSTKLMGTVTAVHVREGDMVRAGQPVVTVDARDLNARDAQVQASILEAEAMYKEAASSGQRMRALYAEEAATRAQLDAAETGLARAEAGVRAARAARAELSAARSYAVIRAPFNGMITARMVDPGAFAAPGAPLVQIEDGRTLRVTGATSPEGIRGLQRGARVQLRIEGAVASGTVEAIVPASGNLYHVNVIVNNQAGRYLPGTAAEIALPQAMRAAIRVPASAVQYAGDLTGVQVASGGKTTLRWVQLGEKQGAEVEVLAGLRVGEEIVVPARSPGAN